MLRKSLSVKSLPLHLFKQRSFSTRNNESLIVIGSGVAGCSTALIAAQTYKIPVTLFCAGSELTNCNSYWAQGGIIYRNYNPNSNDSASSLANDIKRAGAGLCQEDAVWKVSTEGPKRVEQLLLNTEEYANVPFDRDENTNELKYCLEASHSAARIIHYADQSGKAITEEITKAAASHPLISIQPNTLITDLITTGTSAGNICMGVEYFCTESKKIEKKLSTRGVVLASGGLCGIYAHSTNPSGFNALGSSAALAIRAGVEVKDLEYVQFHPTVLYLPNEPRFLLTEALRGEGAILRDANGYAFAKDFHHDGELAPRDIVARGVYQRLKYNPNKHNAFLDVTHHDPSFIKQRFPTIYNYLLSKYNIDMTRDMLPITPAAHYTCGGVATDMHGRTSLTNLYAAGEAARTGLHGGNRLASTSLLEGLVFGASVADFIGSTEFPKDELQIAISEYTSNAEKRNRQTPSYPSENIRNHASELLTRLKHTMWNHVGVERSSDELERAQSILDELKHEIDHLYHNSGISQETVAARDAICAGEKVAEAALNNQISAGTHFIQGAHLERKEHIEDKSTLQLAAL